MDQDYVVVTKHPAISDFLWEIGIRGRAMRIVSRDYISGRTVIGTLPFYLAAYARRIIVPVFRTDPEVPGPPRTLDAARERFTGFQAYRVTYEQIPDDLLEIHRELGIDGHTND